jgi:hypothetical protein
LQVDLNETFLNRLLQFKEEQQRKAKNNPIYDFIVKPKDLLWFPCRLGLTGKAFLEGQISFNNLVEKKSSCPVEAMTEQYLNKNRLRIPNQGEFSKDIDNSLGAKEFENYLIGAIYDEDGLPSGLLQIFNFEEPVTRIQIERFRAMQTFLGGCVGNITEYLKTLQTIFGM